MEKIQLESVYFEKLKGLHDVRIKFEKPLTAIMGINGAGKTTVIHALACIYRPDDSKTDQGNAGEDHHFPEFFVPNTDALWKGSKFHVVNKIATKDNSWKIQDSRVYSKDFDRWAPRYSSRPKRNVYYIGIDTCLPEIEKKTTTSRIIYTSSKRSDKVSKRVLEAAAYVLNKDYEVLVDNLYHNRHFLGVHTRSGLRYSSLSMGTGEQRTIKILEKVINARAYSLVLIDEIDLLLHISALRRLIGKLNEIATNKHLQIVFTTHSLDVLQMEQYVSLQYLYPFTKPDGTSAIFVFDKPNDDIVRSLTGESDLPLKIYVEDTFSQTIIKSILRKHNMAKKAAVLRFGAAHNAFSLAAGFVLSGASYENVLVILDGDEYRMPADKQTQIQKVLSGTEEDAEQKQTQALSLLTQYALPVGKSPEEFIHNLLVESHCENEIVSIARGVQAVTDPHQYINTICEQLQDSVEVLMPQMIAMIESTDEWQAYIAPIENWMLEHQNV